MDNEPAKIFATSKLSMVRSPFLKVKNFDIPDGILGFPGPAETSDLSGSPRTRSPARLFLALECGRRHSLSQDGALAE